VSADLDRHGAPIDADASISKIHSTVVLRSEMPQHISHSAVSETRLSEDRSQCGFQAVRKHEQ
jgi:hypothetical protein